MFAEKINLQDSSYFQLSNIIDEYGTIIVCYWIACVLF